MEMRWQSEEAESSRVKSSQVESSGVKVKPSQVTGAHQRHLAAGDVARRHDHCNVEQCHAEGVGEGEEEELDGEPHGRRARPKVVGSGGVAWQPAKRRGGDRRV
jgi:hypothetical protein